MTNYNERLDEILGNLVNQIACNEQRLLNGNATREETIEWDSNATMRAEKAIQAHTNAEIAKVLDRLAQLSFAELDKAIEAERAKLKEVK